MAYGGVQGLGVGGSGVTGVSSVVASFVFAGWGKIRMFSILYDFGLQKLQDLK